jgi:hypothetical protein
MNSSYFFLDTMALQCHLQRIECALMRPSKGDAVATLTAA